MSRLFSSQLLAVEQRMLFDGAIALTADAAIDRTAVQDKWLASFDATRDIANKAGQVSLGAATRSLIVIDTSVANWQQIADAASPQANLLILDANQDGLAQIASAMVGQKYDAIHIVSHGTEGRLQLGTRAISAANIDQYSADLARIGDGLTDSGDLLLYGCDLSNGAAGARFLQAIARATGADVAASTNDTGAASKGGDWILESATGVIDAAAVFDGARLSAYNDTLAATPAVTLGTAVTTGGGTSNTVLLGEQFTMTATFDNADAVASGFGPYIDVFYAARGVDGGASPDGINFTGANYLGANLTTTFITLTATDITNGTVSHPYYRDSSGSALVAIPAGQGLVAGDKLMVVQLPFGSVTAGQPAAAISLIGALSNGADLGTGLKVLARGGFRYGSDALDNPASDPSIVQAGVAAQTLAPALYRVRTTYLGPENETATGINYTRGYRVDVDVADGQTLTNLQLQDIMPNTLQYAAISGTSTFNNGDAIAAAPSGGAWTNVNGVLVATAAGTSAGSLSSPATASTTLPGGATTRQVSSLTGTSGINDISMVVQFYVPEFDAAAAAVLSATTGDDRLISNEVRVQAAGWVPSDSRDAGTPPTGYVNAAAHVLTAESISTQKSRTIYNNVGLASISPGDGLEYSVDVQISDYFAFGGAAAPVGGAGSQALQIVDTLSDGLAFDNGFGPQLVIQRADGTGQTISISAGSYSVATNTTTTGQQTITVNLRQALVDAGLSSVLVGDQFDADNTQNRAMTAKLIFRANVLDQYRVAPADPDGNPLTGTPNSALNEGDNIVNKATVSGTVLTGSLNPDAAGLNGESDSTIVQDKIAANSVDLTLTSINGGAPTAPIATITPGDSATYRLHYVVPTGDFENFRLSAFLPQPIFSTVDPDGNPATAAVVNWNASGAFSTTPALGFYSVRATRGGTVLGDVVINSATADAGSNGLNFSFIDRDDPLNQPVDIEIYFTLQAEATPFADGLFLTALAESANQNTASQPNTTQSIVQLKVTEPVLNIYKAAVQDDVSGATTFNRAFTSIDPSSLFNNAGNASTNPLSGSGTLTSAQLHGIAGDLTNTLTNVDAGDTVRYAIVIENSGSSVCGAYDIKVRDTFPPGIAIGDVDPASLKVVRGDGTVLVAGVDYIGDINTLFTTGLEFVDMVTPSHPMGIGAARGVDANGMVLNGAAGANILIVTYDVKLPSTTPATSVRSNTTYASAATVFNYTSLDMVNTTTYPDLNYAGTAGISDSGSVSTPLPQINKTIASTSESFTSGANVVVGEVITYTVTLVVPEGVTRGAVFTDTLDPGLAFVAIDSISASSGISPATFTLGTASFNAAADQLTYNFGDIGNTATNSNGVSETITITYRAVATNIAVNQSAHVDANTARFSGTDFAAQVATQSITIVEPQLTITKTPDISTVQIGSTVKYTITISNPVGGVRASEVNLADLVPAGMTFSGFVGAPPAGISAAGNTITGTNIGATGYIDPGTSITFMYTATVDNTATLGQTFNNNASVNWSSLPGNATNISPLTATADSERTGAGGVDDYVNSAGAPVTVQGISVALTIVATSEASSSGSGTPSNPGAAETVNVVPGEIVRYRMIVLLPEANAAGAKITAALPNGLRFLNDSTTTLGFIANGGAGGIDSTAIAGHDIVGTGTTLGDVSSLTPTVLLANSQITDSVGGTNFVSGEDVMFLLGDLVNRDTDAGAEYVVIEFNAVVDNAATQVVRTANLDASFTFSTSAPFSQQSDSDRLVVTEPVITDVNKQVIAVAQTGASGTATFQTTFTNSGNARADAVSVRDTFAAYPNITFGSLTSVTINGVNQPLVTTPAGTLDIVIPFLDPGDSVVVTYTGNITDITQIVPTQDVVVTYTSLSPAGLQLTAAGTTSTTLGERTGLVANYGAAMNTYRDNDGAGVGIIRGRLWDDTPTYPSTTVNDTYDAGEHTLGGQKLNLVQAGADNTFGTADDVYVTQVTSAPDGTYQFNGVIAGNYQVQVVAPMYTDSTPGGGGLIKIRYDVGGGTFAQRSDGVINLAVADGANIQNQDYGYVQLNQAPVATVPTFTVGAPKTIAEDTVLSFDNGGGTNSAATISVADEPENVSNANVATLTVANGSLNFSAGTPLAATIAGLGTSTVTLTGTLANINAALARLQYTPTLNYFGTDALTVKIEDKGAQGDASGDCLPNDPVLDNLMDTKVVNIRITPVNDPPVAQPDLRITSEGAPPLTGNAISGLNSQDVGGAGAAADTDPDTAVLNVVNFMSNNVPANMGVAGATVVGQYGSLTLNANGSYTYTQDAVVVAALPTGTVVNDVFKYTITDGVNAPVQSTITVRVGPADSPPVANPDTNATVEGALTPVLGNVIVKPSGVNGDQSDTDSDTPVASLMIFGAVAATPATAPGLVAGPALTSLPATITGAHGTLTLGMNGAYSYQVNNADPAVIALSPSSAAIQDVFVYTVKDGSLNTSNTTLTINITGINNPPRANDDSKTATVNPNPSAQVATTGRAIVGGTPGDAADSDPDVGDTLSICGIVAGNRTTVADTVLPNTVLGLFGSLTIQADGSYSYTPDARAIALPVGATRVDQFSYCLRDSAGAKDVGLITINLTGVNDPPVAQPEVVDLLKVSPPYSGNSISGGGPGGIDSDPDSDPLNVQGVVRNTVPGPVLGATGSPIAGTYGTLVLQPSGAYVYTINPAAVANLPKSGVVTDVFSYSINDGNGGVATSTITFNIRGVNSPPNGIDRIFTLTEDTPKPLTPADFGFTDPDAGDTFKAVRIDTLPASGVLSLNGVPIMAGQVVPFADIGKLAYTPAKDANSANLSTAPSFNFSVCDQDGAFDPVPNKFTFLITPANDPPVAPITTFIVDGGAQTGSAACLLDAPKLEGTNVLPVVSDPDLPADTLTVTVTSVPPPSSGAFYLPGSTVPLAAGATLTPAQLQQLCFVPNPALSGTPNAQGLIPGGTLAITVSDGKGGTAEGAINVLVRPQAPVARPPVTPIPPIPLIPAIVIPPLTLLGPKTNAVQIAQGLRALDDIRFSPIEAASDLDADGFFDSARIKSVWNREKVAGVQVVAADEQAAPAKKIIDCEPAKPKEKPKLKAVKRSVFADGINDAKSKAFSEQLKSAQKRFKPPVKTTPRTALGKEC